MSRYVDLDGNTWDGKPITSKIQEVKTKCGYMSGITTGWLWGDNVPHIDLEEHNKQIKAEVIDEIIKTLAESEDTILSDRQYYTLMELKENNNVRGNN